MQKTSEFVRIQAFQTEEVFSPEGWAERTLKKILDIADRAAGIDTSKDPEK